MLKDKIIALDSTTSYYIIEETEYNDKKYALMAECNELNDEIDEDNLVIKEIVIKEDGLETKPILDNNLLSKITEILFNKVRN